MQFIELVKKRILTLECCGSQSKMKQSPSLVTGLL